MLALSEAALMFAGVVDLAGSSAGATAAGTEVKSDFVVFDSLEIVQVVVEFDTGN